MLLMMPLPLRLSLPPPLLFSPLMFSLLHPLLLLLLLLPFLFVFPKQPLSTPAPSGPVGESSSSVHPPPDDPALFRFFLENRLPFRAGVESHPPLLLLPWLVLDAEDAAVGVDGGVGSRCSVKPTRAGVENTILSLLLTAEREALGVDGGSCSSSGPGAAAATTDDRGRAGTTTEPCGAATPAAATAAAESIAEYSSRPSPNEDSRMVSKK